MRLILAVALALSARVANAQNNFGCNPLEAAVQKQTGVAATSSIASSFTITADSTTYTTGTASTIAVTLKGSFSSLLIVASSRDAKGAKIDAGTWSITDTAVAASSAQACGGVHVNYLDCATPKNGLSASLKTSTAAADTITIEAVVGICGGTYQWVNLPTVKVVGVSAKTPVPTVLAKTDAPTVATPKTLAPTLAAKTLAPTLAAKTPAPTEAAKTLAPTVAAPETPAPTAAAPKTLAPTLAAKTLAPVEAPKTPVVNMNSCAGPWGLCGATCSDGQPVMQFRTPICVTPTGDAVDLKECPTECATMQQCNVPLCNPHTTTFSTKYSFPPINGVPDRTPVPARAPPVTSVPRTAAPVTCSRDSLCFDARFTCDSCCTTGKAVDGTACWGGFFTPSRCCNAATGAGASYVAPPPPPSTAAPVTTFSTPTNQFAPASCAKDVTCFSEIYTCSSCCALGHSGPATGMKQCWDASYTEERCCKIVSTDGTIIASDVPVTSPPVANQQTCARDLSCFDNAYPCEGCCSTGLNRYGTTCWDEKYTPARCCLADNSSPTSAPAATVTSSPTAPPVLNPAPAQADCAKSLSCFDLTYTCASCCSSGVATNGAGCWNAIYSAERCCNNPGSTGSPPPPPPPPPPSASTPAATPTPSNPSPAGATCARDVSCFNGLYPCEQCCNSGLNVQGNTCWGGAYTASRCCNSPSSSFPSANPPPPPPVTAAPVLAPPPFTPPSFTPPFMPPPSFTPPFMPPPVTPPFTPPPVFPPPFTPPSVFTPPFTPPAPGLSCADSMAACSAWAGQSLCGMAFVQQNCQLSCNSCGRRKGQHPAQLQFDRNLNGFLVGSDGTVARSSFYIDREGRIADMRSGLPIGEPPAEYEARSSGVARLPHGLGCTLMAVVLALGRQVLM